MSKIKFLFNIFIILILIQFSSIPSIASNYSENVEIVITNIESLPSVDEIETEMDKLSDDENYIYIENIKSEINIAYDLYLNLSEEEKLLVTNYTKLEDLLWLVDYSVENYATAGANMGYGNNVYPIEAINVFNTNANVILANVNLKNLNNFFGTLDFSSYWAVRVEMRADGRYTCIQSHDAAGTTATQNADGFLLLIKKSAYPNGYYPYAHWPEGGSGNHTVETNGDTAHINCSQYKTTNKLDYTGTPYGYITFTPKNISTSSANRIGDIEPVGPEANIEFKLFNYNENINKNSSGSFRSLATYFNFRSSLIEGEAPATNTTYDADGFTVNHATVEYMLDSNGYPVLDLTRDALGNSKTDPGLSLANRKLGFLFGDELPDGADSLYPGAITAYNPSNTILRGNGTEYWYNSPENAIDFNINENKFILRPYAERGNSTAGYGTKNEYYDFLPFNYTNGVVIGTSGTDGREYHLNGTDIDYWFGMTMELEYYQPKNGMSGDEPLVFTFYGDDDVWVFIDDVLVLDLGGTHGAVRGEIDFSTGKVVNTLDFNGANGKEGTTSFSTTLTECFSNASKFKGETVTPKGGWSKRNPSIFDDYTKHTLKLFYLERGAGVANCNMFFNLPNLPDETLIVNKSLELDPDIPGLAEYLSGTLSYRYRVLKVDDDGNPTNELFVNPGETYTLIKSDGSSVEKIVGNDGYFELKAGEAAKFNEMLSKQDGTELNYVVEEVLPNILKGQYSHIEYIVNSDINEILPEGSDISETFTSYHTPSLSAETSQIVTYKNIVDGSKLCTLSITKKVTNDLDFDVNKEFKVRVKLGDELLPVGTEYVINGVVKTVSDEGIILLKAGETAILSSGVLSGTEFEIVEIDTAGIFTIYSGEIIETNKTTKLDPSNNGMNGSFPLGSAVSVIIENSRSDYNLDIIISKEVKSFIGSQKFYFSLYNCDEYGNILDSNSISRTFININNNEKVFNNIKIGINSEKVSNGEILYYKVIEEKDLSLPFVFDENTYLIVVKVNKTNTDIEAEIVNVFKYDSNNVKDDNYIFDGEISFVNHIIKDELPSMGGNGYNIFIISGSFFCILGILCCLIYIKSKRG